MIVQLYAHKTQSGIYHCRYRRFRRAEETNRCSDRRTAADVEWRLGYQRSQSTGTHHEAAADVSRGASQDSCCATEEVGRSTDGWFGVGAQLRAGPQEAEAERRWPEGDYRSDKTAVGYGTGSKEAVIPARGLL
jgi:hypothetical protein